MRDNNGLDNAITMALYDMTDALSLDGTCKERIRHRMTAPEREGRTMKRFGIKKLVIAAAVCAFFVGTMAIAGGGKDVVTRLGAGSLFDNYSDYKDLEKLTKKADINPLTVESFSNGYTFSEMHLSTTTDLDADDNVLNKYHDINLDYEREGSPRVYVSMQPQFQFTIDEERAQASRIADDTEIVYYLDEYLGVPDRTDVTEEELQREEEDPHFFISEGLDERREYLAGGAVFIKDGILYHIGSFDPDLTPDDFLDMAVEILTMGVTVE